MTQTKKFRLIPQNTSSVLTISILVLCIFSSIMITSALVPSNASADANILSSAYVLKELVVQFGYMTVAFIIYGYFAHTFSIEKITRYIPYIAIGEGVLLFMAFVCTRIFFPKGIGGSYAWLTVGVGPSIQPSEFAKPVMVIIIAAVLCDKKFRNEINAWQVMRLPIITFISYVFMVVVLQSDFGSAIIICAVTVITFFMCDHPIYQKYQKWAFILTCLFMLAFFGLMNDSFRSFVESLGFDKLAVTLSRFHAASNPAYSINDKSRELYNSLYGIANGSVSGLGYGGSIQKYGYLGAPESDYIFSVIVEEMGAFGVAMIFIPYFCIFATLITYAFKVKKQSDKCILVGGFTYLFVHFFFNIGGVTGLMALTGVPLLMVSSGGTSLVSCLTTLGICQSVIKRYNTEKNMRHIV